MAELDRRLSRIEDTIGLGLMERSLVEPSEPPNTATDETTSDGVPVEPIHTIEHVKKVVGASARENLAAGSGIKRTLQGSIGVMVAIAVGLFATGLTIGLLIGR